MSQLGQIHFTVEQVTKLLAMQDQLNTYIHPEWKSQDFDWNFAIIDECREIKEHLGWKWWKESYKCGLTESNRKQVQLEVIDILHFVLSIAGECHTDVNSVTRWLNYGKRYDPIGWDEALEWMLEEAITKGSDTYEYWTVLAILSGLTTEQVIETYTQKFVLNKFRQDHGYKNGSYVKVWSLSYPTPQTQEHPCEDLLVVEKEDNEVLADIVEELGNDGDDITSEVLLYRYLEMAYAARLNK